MQGRSPAMERWNSHEILPEMEEAQIPTSKGDRFNVFLKPYSPISPSKTRVPRALKPNSKDLNCTNDRNVSLSQSQAKPSPEIIGNMTSSNLSIEDTEYRALSQIGDKAREIDFLSDHDSEASSICRSPGWDDLSGKKSKEKRAKKRREKERREREERERLKFGSKGRPVLQPIKQREREQRKISEKKNSTEREKHLLRPKKLSKQPPKDHKKLASFRSNLDPLLRHHQPQARAVDSGREFDNIDAKGSLLPSSPLNISPVLHSNLNQERNFIGGLKLRKVEEASVQDAIKKIRVGNLQENKFALPQSLDDGSAKNDDSSSAHQKRPPYIEGLPARYPRYIDQFTSQRTKIECNSYEAPVHAEDFPARTSLGQAYHSTTHYFEDKSDKKVHASEYENSRNSSYQKTDDLNVQPLSLNKSGQRLNLSHQLRRQSIHIHDFVKDELDSPIDFEMAQKSQESPNERGSATGSRGFHTLIQDIKALRSFTEHSDHLEPSRKPKSVWRENESPGRSTPENTINSHENSLRKPERVLGEAISTLLTEDFVEQRPYSRSINSPHCIDPDDCMSPSRSTATSSEEDSTYEELSNITTPFVSRPHSTKDKSPERYSPEMTRTPRSNLSAEDKILSCSVYSTELHLEDKDRLSTPNSATSEQLKTIAGLSGLESSSTSEDRRQESQHRNHILGSRFLPNHLQRAVAWPSNGNERNGRGLIRKPPRSKESCRPLNLSEPSDYLQRARKNISPSGSSPGSPGSLRNKYLAQKTVDPFAKMFVVCCSCKYFHDLPSKVYACMAGPSNVVTEKNLGVSGIMTTSVECPWCGHRMTTTCCAGYAAIVYMKERLH